jgi:hypothetical protein
VLTWLTTAALAACQPTDVGSFVDRVQAPAVVILGERHGDRGDLRRAGEVVRALRERAPVTLAVEALDTSHQGAIEAWAEEERGLCRLKRVTDWKEDWGYPFRTYRPLLREARRGATLVAAGLPIGPAPDGVEIEIPEGYAAALAGAMAAHGDMPPEMLDRFTRSMAWRDLQIGTAGVDGWTGEGVLVIVTGRGHVEGGRGTAWQLERLLDVPVHEAILDPEGAECPADDVVLVDG